MSATELDNFAKQPERMRIFQQERAIQEVTELICQIMDEENVNRAQLARRLDKTKGYVTQLLDGRANMTVRTLSDVFLALDRLIHFQDSDSKCKHRYEPLRILEPFHWSPEMAPWPEIQTRIRSAPRMRPDFDARLTA